MIEVNITKWNVAQMIEVNITKWNVVIRHKIRISAIWMYKKCNNMLYCFRYEIFPFEKYFWE